MAAEWPAHLDPEALAAELGQLRQALASAPRPKGTEQRLTAVFKLVGGLPVGAFVELAERLHLQDWLATPLDGPAYPLLHQLKTTLEELHHQTRHDALTGLLNRRAFDVSLDIELERARRNRAPICLVVLDLDHFKAVNDTYGHGCGDRVLVAFAQVLAQAKRRYDVAARIGGEEFALILPGAGMMRGQAMVARVMDRVRQLRIDCDQAQLQITCSMGLACSRGKVTLEPEVFLELADKALYQAKAEGRNRVCYAPIPDLATVDTEKTLVQASEKQFLFTGHSQRDAS